MGQPGGRADCRRCVFGARRSDTIPLVSEARSWDEGVYKAATMGSGDDGRRNRRRRRSAARPVCDAAVLRLSHRRLFPALAAIWARRRHIRRVSSASTGSARTTNGRFVWPGFGQNMRVLKWIFDRCGGARERDGNATRLRAALRRHRLERLRFRRPAIFQCHGSRPGAVGDRARLARSILRALEAKRPDALMSERDRLAGRIAM